MNDLDLSIFHDYDIRGVYPSEVNESTFFLLGKALSTYFGGSEIAVGTDCRLSSPSLFQALTDGILSCGTNVADLGLISTEMHNFASGYYQFCANIIISASHNPPQYNGAKIIRKGVIPLSGEEGLPEIKAIIEKNAYKESEKKGVLRKKEIMSDWITHLLSFIDRRKLKKLKVVIDAGNGMGGIAWRQLQEHLPIEIIPLYFTPDGYFPNHLPDPLNPANLASVAKEIVSQKADLGFAHDGDADRVFLLDEKGKIVSGTITTAILADYLLEKYGPGPILYNAVCGRIVPQAIEKKGGTPYRVRVGHSFIKRAMREKKALFAGEHSGHFYFRDNFYADSSTIAGLFLLECFSGTTQRVSKVVHAFDIYKTSGEINFKGADSQTVFAKLAKTFEDAHIDYVDGLSIWYPEWWASIRASKTEPLLRVNLEADTIAILKENLEKVENIIQSLGGVKK